jgi:ribosomal protein L6P/L9E
MDIPERVKIKVNALSHVANLITGFTKG